MRVVVGTEVPAYATLDPSGVSVCRDDGACVRHLAIRDVEAAWVRRELWLVGGGVWTRLDAEGDLLGRVEHEALYGGPLIAAPPPASIAAMPRALLTLSGGGPSVEPIGAGVPLELVAPIGPGLTLLASSAAVRLRRGAADLWVQTGILDGRPRDAAPLFEGRSVALVTSRPDGFRLLVLSARDGAVRQNLALRGASAIVIGARRGHALVQLGDQRLVSVDLRFGKAVRELIAPRPVRALGADAALEQIVIVPDDDDAPPIVGLEAFGASGEVALHDREDEPDTPPPPPAEAPPEPPAPPPPRAPVIDRDAPLAALWPMPPRERCTPDESAAVLQRHIALIAALTERAIAHGWDTGRIAPAVPQPLPFEHEVDGILELAGNHAPERLRAAEERVARAQAAVLERVRALGDRLAPLTALASEFGLSPLAADVLMVVAAPLLWGELTRLYGIAANDIARAGCDELLICQILAPRAARRAIARELDRDQPLRRYGLIVGDDTATRPFGALRPDPLVLRRLRDLPLDADVEPFLRPLPPARALEQLRIPADVIDRLLAALVVDTPGAPIRIALRGRTGAGRRTLLAALAARAGRTLGVVNAGQHARDNARRIELVRLGLQRAMLRGWLPVVEGLDDLAGDDRATRDELAGVFCAHPGPLALRLPWDAPVPLAPGFVQVDLPVLSEGERRAAWQDALARHRLVVADVDDLAARFRVAPGVIEAVAGVAARTPGAQLERDQDVDREVRQHLQGRLGDLAHRVARLASWSDVVLPPDVLDSVVELIARIRHRRRVYEEWGFDRAMTTSRGLTVLFQGGPGTGKTMVAGAIARELGLDLYRIDLSKVVSKWIGETERNLANVFDASEDGQAILLFDEADSLFAKRTEVRTSVDRYANLEVNYLLQRLDSFEGIAILTTNFGGSIDKAFQRRLSLRLTYPFPDDEMREQLWRVHLPPTLPRHGAFDLGALAARYRLSGGYIRNACLRAAFLAAEEGVPVAQEHLERAVRLEFREIGKLGDTGALE